MRKLVALVVLACIFPAMAFAADKIAIPSDAVVIKGTLIDNMCAEANKGDIDKFVKTHTKECALMPACAASGYSLYVDGKLVNLDAGSSAMAEEFLKAPDSKLDVEMEVENKEGDLSVISIMNRK
jgi:hypothetical protein